MHDISGHNCDWRAYTTYTPKTELLIPTYYSYQLLRDTSCAYAYGNRGLSLLN